MKILLENSSAKVGLEDIFKPATGNEIYTELLMIMELKNKLCHVKRPNGQEYNVPT
jgi:hypothetical protein